MQMTSHNKSSPTRLRVVGAEPDFDPRWVFHEVQATVRTESRAVCDDTLFDIVERVARHNSNLEYRGMAHAILARWAA